MISLMFRKVILEKNCQTPESSKKLAQEIAHTIFSPHKNFTIFFKGGLGAGKSFLTREILRTFLITQEIPSPTYTLVNEYTCPKKKNFAHFDLYRLTDPQEFFNRGLIEIAEDPEISCFVEWPERLPIITKNTFSGKHFTIQIDHGIGVGMRKIKITQ